VPCMGVARKKSCFVTACVSEVSRSSSGSSSSCSSAVHLCSSCNSLQENDGVVVRSLHVYRDRRVYVRCRAISRGRWNCSADQRDDRQRTSAVSATVHRILFVLNMLSFTHNVSRNHKLQQFNQLNKNSFNRDGSGIRSWSELHTYERVR